MQRNKGIDFEIRSKGVSHYDSINTSVSRSFAVVGDENFNPGQLSNLKWWLRADGNLSSSGADNTVQVWYDESGNGIHMHNIDSGPRFSSSMPCFNNRAGIIFDTGDQYLTGNHSSDVEFAVTGTRLYIVTQWLNEPNHSFLLSKEEGGQESWRINAISGSLLAGYIQAHLYGFSPGDSSASFDGGTHIIRYDTFTNPADPGGIALNSLRVDREIAGSEDGHFILNTSTANLFMGADEGTSKFGYWAVAEIIMAQIDDISVIDGLSEDDLVINYLVNKYALTQSILIDLSEVGTYDRNTSDNYFASGSTARNYFSGGFAVRKRGTNTWWHVFEGQHRNICGGSHKFDSGWVDDLQGSMLTASQISAPNADGEGALIYFSSTNDSRISSIEIETMTGSAPMWVSMWAKTASGTKDFRLAINEQNLQQSSDLTATTTWQRFSASFVADGGDVLTVRVYNDVAGTEGTMYGWGIEARQDHGDLELLHPIFFSGATRTADDLSLAFSEIPPSFLTGGCWFKIKPYFSHDAWMSRSVDGYLLWLGGDNYFAMSSSSTMAFAADGEVAVSTAKTWSPLQEITCIIDFFKKQITFNGFTTGDEVLDISSASSGSWNTIFNSVGTQSLQIGNVDSASDLANPFFGEITDIYPLETAPTF